MHARCKHASGTMGHIPICSFSLATKISPQAKMDANLVLVEQPTRHHVNWMPSQTGVTQLGHIPYMSLPTIAPKEPGGLILSLLQQVHCEVKLGYN